jgi:hypothetical protein
MKEVLPSDALVIAVEIGGQENPHTAAVTVQMTFARNLSVQRPYQMHRAQPTRKAAGKMTHASDVP